MKKIFLLLFLITLVISAQETDTTLYKWHPSLVTGLNLSQISFKNWSKGGDNSITWTVFTDFSLLYKTQDWRFANQFKAAYGRTKIGGTDYRTNNNEIFLESVLSYQAGWSIDPFISNSVRTQITKGYDYKVEPVVSIADFFDPGYITQSIGFAYNQYEKVTTRMGVAFQEVFTNEFHSYSDDPETNKIEKFKFETGIESVTDAEFGVMENITYKSKLRLFSRFESLDVWDVRWDNNLVAKVNSFINVNINFLLVHEISQSRRTQMKEALQLGIAYRIL